MSFVYEPIRGVGVEKGAYGYNIADRRGAKKGSFIGEGVRYLHSDGSWRKKILDGEMITGSFRLKDARELLDDHLPSLRK